MMSRFLISIALLIFMSINVNAGFRTTENFIEVDTIVSLSGISSEKLFANCRMALSELAGINKSKYNIDYTDREAGLISSKGKIFIGFGKVNPVCGYDVYADCMLTIRCKDNRFKILVKIPSLYFDWSCDKTSNETVPISVCYPKYNKKIYKTKHHYISNASDKCIDELIPTVNGFIQQIISKIITASDDDF